MRFKLGFFLFLGFHSLVFARTLIISDLDDTAKISLVTKKHLAALYAPQVTNSFLGIAELYRAVAKQNPEAQFVYLSNGPEWLMGNKHREYVRENAFPQGPVLTRTDMTQKNQKVNHFRSLLFTGDYDQVWFFGDNGEHDSQVYDQISKQFPHIETKTFIHTAFATEVGEGHPLLEKQIPWASPLDLALSLASANILKDDAAIEFFTKHYSEYLKQRSSQNYGELAFPSWINVEDFLKSDHIKQLQNGLGSHSKISLSFLDYINSLKQFTRPLATQKGLGWRLCTELFQSK